MHKFGTLSAMGLLTVQGVKVLCPGHHHGQTTNKEECNLAQIKNKEEPVAEAALTVDETGAEVKV